MYEGKSQINYPPSKADTKTIYNDIQYKFNFKQLTVVDDNYQLKNKENILIDTGGGEFSILLPLTPVFFDTISFIDIASNLETNNLIIDNNTNNIMGLNEELILDNNNSVFSLIYINSTTGWKIFEGYSYFNENYHVI